MWCSTPIFLSSVDRYKRNKTFLLINFNLIHRIIYNLIWNKENFCKQHYYLLAYISYWLKVLFNSERMVIPNNDVSKALKKSKLYHVTETLKSDIPTKGNKNDHRLKICVSDLNPMYVIQQPRKGAMNL